MATISIVVFITLTFAATNLLVQLGAVDYIRRSERAQAGGRAYGAGASVPRSSGAGRTRTRTDRHDLQMAIGHDFAAPDVQDTVWPRDPRY